MIFGTITVFGAIALDCRLTACRPLVPATSNPATARERPGGVARNIAAYLADLGADVRLVSRLGEDAAGTALLHDLAQRHIDSAHVARSRTAATARYWAVLEPAGELALGLADMAVLDEIDPRALDAAARLPAAAWFLDANLPEACIDHLLDHPCRPELLAADTVSVSKAGKLAGRLAAVDLLFTNAAEAAVLVGAADAAALVLAGAGAVVIGRGAAGLDVADASGSRHLPVLASAVGVKDVTGAGDALAAATLWGRLSGLDLFTAARLGRLAAAAVITESTFFALQHLHDLARVADKALHAELVRLLPRGCGGP